jgi:hypothetical protein
MADRVVDKLDLAKELFLSMAGGLIMAALALFGLVDTAQSRAQWADSGNQVYQRRLLP